MSTRKKKAKSLHGRQKCNKPKDNEEPPREAKATKEAKEPKEIKGSKASKEAKEPKAAKAKKEATEPSERKEPKAKKEPNASKEPKAKKEAKEKEPSLKAFAIIAESTDIEQQAAGTKRCPFLDAIRPR